MPLANMILMAIGLCLGAAATAAPTIDKAWTSNSKIATPRTVDIGLPLQVGTFESRAFVDLGTAGADLAAQYETRDTKVIGTVFLYAPSRPDVGLTFLATDQTIRRRLGPSATVVEDALITIKGVANAGRRVVYEGKADAKLSGDFDGRVYSTATFFRADKWIVVARASGPVSRAAEIGQDLDALVAGMTFGKRMSVFPTHKIAVESCSPPVHRKEVDVLKPPMAEAAEAWLALEPDADQAGVAVANSLLGSIDGICLERSEMVGESPLLTYRVVRAASTGVLNPRLAMLYGDAGEMLLALESKKHPGQYFISRHAIGIVHVVGRTSALPSDQQLKAILYHPENQPVIIVMKTNLQSRPQRTDISIDCNLTAEGCGKAKK